MNYSSFHFVFHLRSSHGKLLEVQNATPFITVARQLGVDCLGPVLVLDTRGGGWGGRKDIRITNRDPHWSETPNTCRTADPIQEGPTGLENRLINLH